MRSFSVVSACAGLWCAVVIAGCASAPAARSAEAIIAEYEAVEMPRMDWSREDDPEYAAEFNAKYYAAFDRRGDLALELYEAHPEHEKVPELVIRRWTWPRDDPERTKRSLREMRAFAARHSADTELGRRVRHGLAWKRMADAIHYDGDIEDAHAAFEWYLSEVGRGEHDASTADLLWQMNWAYERGSAEQIAALERIRDDFPGTSAARRSEGLLHQYASIGKPFRVEFSCAVTGERVDTSEMSGRVVLVDFWATWCPPCVAKMPKLKEIYERHHEDGLEVIGISLDQPLEDGGLDRLREFVEKNELPWPQWYLGRGWESEFSRGWGISGIPTLFLVDAQGILRSTTVRPDGMEEAIVELLEERSARAAADAGK